MSGTSERQANPYRPGFNQAPTVFAGRAEILDGAGEALEVAAFDGRTPRPLILVGPRGVGKTVTLGEIAHIAAEQHSWPAVHVEAKAGGLVAELASRLGRAQRLLEGAEPVEHRSKTRISGAKIQASVLGVGGGIEVERERIDHDVDLAAALRGTMAAAVARGAGLLLTLDELQNAAPDELHVLGGVLQESVPEGWPLVVAIAALPSLRGKRGPRRLPTYLERAEWYELDALPQHDARLALVEPAERAGRPMTAAAAELLLGLTGGYPYAIQVAGHFAWRASHGSTTIGKEHAAAAEPKIVADLEQLFTSRWEDASPREREYLTALAAAAVGHPSPNGGHVAAVLGQPVTAVSYLRDRLMKKGTIYRDGSGGLAFITPGMGEWVRRRSNPR